MKKIILIVLLTNLTLLVGQSEKPSAFGISFSGFLKTDLILDSRQVVSIREGHFLLYPQTENFDVMGVDINDKASFNILSIQSRLNGKITGPDAFDAATSGVLEGEFFGTSDGDVNGFRLRHAFVKLDWEKLSLLVGQTWHPMFITEMFPGVVSFNTGVPFQPFARNPQVRFTYTENNLKFILVAASQRDFTSNGPDGFSSSYLRNSILPNLHAQVQYSSKTYLVGAGVDFKKLAPRIVTPLKYVTKESINTLSAIGFVKLNLDPVTIKAEGVYGNNLADLLMLGGYAVESTNPSTGLETYTPLGAYSLWGEISTGKEIEFALFGGYIKNLGAKENITGAYYGRGTNIDNVFRVSPRVQFNSGKVRISTELEYTSAGYGTPNGLNKGIVENIKNVANVRLLFATFYFF